MAHFVAATVAALLLFLLGAEAFFAGAFPEQPQASRAAGRKTALHAFGKTMRRVRESLTNQERSREDLKIGIAGFYDRSSKLWENVWGERKIILFVLDFGLVEDLK